MAAVMSKHSFLYELNAYAFVKRLSKQYQKRLSLMTIPPKEWKSITSSGFDYLWLMGVWKRSPAAHRCALEVPEWRYGYTEALPDWNEGDIAGSPYAVYDYTMDSFIGEDGNILEFKAYLNKLGVKLILDFVPNHFALDHPGTRTNPEAFIQGTAEDFKKYPDLFFEAHKNQFFAHGRDPYFPAWPDTVQVNYFSDSFRDRTMRLLCQLSQIADGIRCDMAMLGLSRVFQNTWGSFLKEKMPEKEYWLEVITAVKKKNPEFIFIAEAYWDLEWELQQLGFDYTYDKRLYDRLLHASPQDVATHLRADISYQRKSVRFIENHDETRAVTAFGKERSYAAAVVVNTVPGLSMCHDGQQEGRRIKLPVQMATEPGEESDRETQEFYEILLKYATAEPIKNSVWNLHEVTSAWEHNESFRNILAWSWTHKTKAKLIVINYSSANSQGKICLPDNWLANSPVNFEDKLNGEVYTWDPLELKAQGLYVKLAPWKSHFFELRIPENKTIKKKD